MKTKSLDWSYPTSDNAVRFGFKAGCWTINQYQQGRLPLALRGFATREEAITFAETLTLRWNITTLRFYPELETTR